MVRSFDVRSYNDFWLKGIEQGDIVRVHKAGGKAVLYRVVEKNDVSLQVECLNWWDALTFNISSFWNSLWR
jgi:hypothetical protein